MIYLLNFDITYIITLLHVSTLMSHFRRKFQDLLYILFYSFFCRTIAIVRQKKL